MLTSSSPPIFTKLAIGIIQLFAVLVLGIGIAFTSFFLTFRAGSLLIIHLFDKKPIARVFRLNDPKAEYTIHKGEYYYTVQYKRGSRTPQGYIGSTKVDLEPYVDKPIKVIGSWRESGGKIMIYKDSPDVFGTGMIIDIEAVKEL